MKKVKWGIIGLGNMAHKIASALEVVEDAELTAAASRSKEKAVEFGIQYGLGNDKCYDNYEKVAVNDEVDVVYIATPVGLHKRDALMCMENGKAVLCEKSVAENAADVEDIVAVSREKGIFFMEAMWTRFLPVYQDVKQWLEDERIGKIQMLDADMSIANGLDKDDIRFDPGLGGGALLDLGIYPISFSSFIFNEQPERVSSTAWFGGTGVDEQIAASLGYNDHRVVSMICSMDAQSPGRAVLVGTKGRIEIDKFWYSQKAELYIDDKVIETAERPHEINGYEYELREVVDCLQQGKEESDVMPRQESIEIMKTMDRVRQAWKSQG